MPSSSLLDFKISPVSIQRSAVEKLRSAVLAGVFKPGDRLVEARLCDLLGISRASVREALRSLEAEKLIEIVPNRGPLVRLLTWEEAEQIYDVRAILEGEASALSASRATPEQLNALRKALKSFESAVRKQDPQGRVTAAAQFYQIILEACGNAIIQELLQGLVARISFLRQRSMSQTGRAKESAKEMARILGAIEAQKPGEARRAAIEHVEQACAAARSVFAAEQEVGTVAAKRVARKA